MIDEEVVNWVVNDIKRQLQGVTKETSRNFLKGIRDDPKGVQRFLYAHSVSWELQMVMETGNPVHVLEVQTLPQKVFEKLQQKLAEQIKALPA